MSTLNPLSTTNPGIIDKDKFQFEHEIRMLQGEISNIAAHVTIDSQMRIQYSQLIAKMSTELQVKVSMGEKTWKLAAKEAQETRNIIMNSIRNKSTPVGRSIAEYLKKDGKTLNELITRNTKKLYGTSASFNHLNQAQQNNVFHAIIKSSGTTNPDVSLALSRFSKAGRGLIIFSLAISVYNIATSNDKAAATRYEVDVTGAGVGGGVAGGALAGFACGPASPICVTIGAFVGGALAAFGVSVAWNW